MKFNLSSLRGLVKISEVDCLYQQTQVRCHHFEHDLARNDVLYLYAQFLNAEWDFCYGFIALVLSHLIKM